MSSNFTSPTNLWPPFEFLGFTSETEVVASFGITFEDLQGINTEEKVGLDNTSPPNAPTDLVATVISSSRIDLIWTHNGINVNRFEIQRCKP